MSKILNSKLRSWCALAVSVAYLIFSFSWKAAWGWWSFCDGFFMFMAAFTHICALYIGRINPYASKKLDLFALILFVLFIVAFIVEWIVMSVI